MELIPHEKDTITFNTLEIPEDTQYWFCRANGGEFYEDFKKNSFIAVENDGINLDQLTLLETTYKDSSYSEKEKLVLNGYKNIYLSSDFYKNLLKKMNEEEPTEKEKNESSYKRKASIAATRSFNFIYRMKIGDLVIVPGIRSQQYLIGIITSNEFDFEIDRVTENITSACPFKFKRTVHWIREISKKDFPNSLSWGINAQKTIYDITSFAEDINKLIATSYIYKDNFYHQLLVKTPEPITSYQWFQFQRAIFEVAEEKSKEIFIKTNVQSPGVVEFITNPTNLPIIMIGIGLLFGDIDATKLGINARFKGLIPYFMPAERAQRKALKKRLELETTELEIQHDSANKRAEIELEKLVEELEALKLTNKDKSLEIEKKEIEVEILRQQKLKKLSIESEEKLFKESTKTIDINHRQDSLPSFDKAQSESIKDLQVEDPSVNIEKQYQKKKDSDD